MFDNQNQQSNNNGNNKVKKNINLLPEQLRKNSSAPPVKSPAMPDIEYSKVENIVSQPKASSGFMEKFKGVFGFLKKKKKFDSIGSRKNGNLVDESTPLQKLYAKKISQNKNIAKTLKLPVLDLKKDKKNGQIEKLTTVKLEPILSKTKPKPHKDSDSLLKVPMSTSKPSQEESVDVKQSLSVLDRIDQQLQKGKELMSEKKSEKDEHGINLIPEKMVSEVDERKIVQTLILVSILAVFLIGLTWLIIDLVQLRETKQVDKLRQKIQISEESFISKSKDLQALLAYQNTYDNIGLLLNNHLYWSELLEFLERNVIPEVYFTEITADKNGIVEISMMANDYYSLAQQYKVFKDTPEVLRINLEGASLNDEDGDLSMIEDVAKQIERARNDSSATSTQAGMISTQKLIIDAYKNMPVKTVMYLYLNKKDLFYR